MPRPRSERELHDHSEERLLETRGGDALAGSLEDLMELGLPQGHGDAPVDVQVKD